MSISYLMIGSNDLDRSRQFYDAVMPHIGGAPGHDYPGITFSYQFADGVQIWISKPYDKGPASAANGSMPGFGCAKSRAGGSSRRRTGWPRTRRAAS